MMADSDSEQPYALGNEWFVNRSGGREGPFDSRIQAQRYLDLLKAVTAVRLGAVSSVSEHSDIAEY